MADGIDPVVALQPPKVPRASFSVVVPCFNALATIAGSIASAEAQSLLPLEIIVVDDGSSDGSADLVAKLAGNNPSIRLLRQLNSGVSSARNAGVAAARGEFIAFLDSDDVWHSEFLFSHAAHFLANPDLGVSFSNVRIMGPDGHITNDVSRAQLAGITPETILISNPTTTCSTWAVRRRVLIDVGTFTETLHRDEDREWLFRVAVSPWRIAGLPTALVDYRTSPSGLSADLDGMWRGFQTMLANAGRIAPEITHRAAPMATAGTLRYLARRALRLGLAPHVARNYMLDALKAAPSLLWREPRATLPTLAAALIPGAQRLIYGSPSHPAGLAHS
jgi:GT2 family glycosyltransferase